MRVYATLPGYRLISTQRGAEERRGLLSEERAGDSNCGKIHPAFGAQFIICLCTSMSEMQKVGDTGDIYISAIFLAGANFWAIFGHFGVISDHGVTIKSCQCFNQLTFNLYISISMLDLKIYLSLYISFVGYMSGAMHL